MNSFDFLCNDFVWCIYDHNKANMKNEMIAVWIVAISSVLIIIILPDH